MDTKSLENLNKYAVVAWTEYSDEDKGWEVQNTGISYAQARNICDIVNRKDFEAGVDPSKFKYRVAAVKYEIVG